MLDFGLSTEACLHKSRGISYRLSVKGEIMAKFFTQEWGDLYKEAINNNKAYEESAKTWEGDFYFIMEAGGPVEATTYSYIDLYHGKCRKIEVVRDPAKYKPEFTMSASYSVWKRIATKELDPIKAMITRQAKLTGNMAKIMRYVKAANELTTSTTHVPTEWPA
jgi:putative sterol carrier protein